MAATHKRGRGQRGYLPGTQCILWLLACSGRPPSPAPFWFRFRLHVQNARLGSAPAADPGNVLASVHRLKGQDVPSGGILAGEQPGRSRGAAVSRSGRST